MGEAWRARLGSVARIGLVAGIAVVVGIQFVPYGRDHDNPPVVADAPWPDAASRELARGACYDCHSNETDWPWYSWIAPMSWLVQRDVENGREELNFSDWDADRGPRDAEDAAEVVDEGGRPPRQYQLIHSAARLSAAERDQLVAALTQMAGEDRGGDDRSGPGGGGDDRSPDDRSGSNSGPG